MSEAILYTGQHDFDSTALRWLVAEKEAPVLVRWLGPHTTHLVEPPYLIDRELQLTDHWTIVQYLQERYPGEQLMPVDPQVRGMIRQMCVFLRDGDTTEEELCEILPRRGAYILGDAFTLADVYAGAFLTARAPTKVKTKEYLLRLLRRPTWKEAHDERTPQRYLVRSAEEALQGEEVPQPRGLLEGLLQDAG